MSGDSRTVTTDALATLGTIITSGGRDAIHLAVEPTVARERLSPGQDVGVDGSSNKPHVGIVDPFLKSAVKAGEMFWLVVYPRQITSLRHVWVHPAFSDAGKQESEKWLKRFMKEHDCDDDEDYMNIVGAASGAWNDNPDDLHIGGTVIYGTIPSEFWNHVEVVTGKKISNRPNHFSCSC